MVDKQEGVFVGGSNDQVGVNADFADSSFQQGTTITVTNYRICYHYYTHIIT